MRDDRNNLAELPSEILINILMHLDLIDCIRAGRVCVSWRAAWAEMVACKLHPPSHQLPLLVLSRKNEIYPVFNLSEKKVYSLHLPQAYGAANCLGSFDGWLIMMDKMNGYSLFNVTSRDFIQLPRQIGFSNSDSHPRNVELFWEECLKMDAKVILSSDPTSGDCWVVIFWSGVNKWGEQMALCKVGDAVWTILKGDGYRGKSHITFYRDHLLMIRFMNGIKMYELDLHELDLRPKPTEWWNWISHPKIEYSQNANIFPLSHDAFVLGIYLVESCGELLMVLRIVNTGEFLGGFFGGYQRSSRLKTTTFRIFKMDPNGSSWIKVKSLGDQMLFLNYSNSKSISAKGLVGFKGNCIYFTKDKDMLMDNDSGMFDLDDGSILRFPLSIPSSIPSYSCDLPQWVTPYPAYPKH